MPLTNFPHGIFATPNLPGSAGIPPTTGNIWFVDATGGSSAHDGKSPSTPLATIDQAIDKCTANNGDQIWVMENHAETISGATSLVPDVAGVSIFGLGEGRQRPTLTFSATTSKIAVSGADVRISGLVFVAGISAVVVGIDVNADDFTMDGCEFNYSTTAYDFAIMVDIDAYDRATIRNCKFIAEDTAGSNEAIRLDDTHGVVIEGCQFSGDFTNAMIYSAGGDALGKDLLVRDCWGYNSDTTLGANIDLNVAFTGTLANCAFSTAYTAGVDDTFDAGACGCINCNVAWVGDFNWFPVPFGLLPSWYVAKKAITFTRAAAGTVGTGGLFTISGTFEAQMVGVMGTAAAGTAGTISVGLTGDTDALLPVVTYTSLAAKYVWIHTAAAASDSAWGDMKHVPVVINGAASPSIFTTIATNAVKSGACDFHLYWRPLEPGAYVRAK